MDPKLPPSKEFYDKPYSSSSAVAHQVGILPHKVNSEYHDEYVPRSVQGNSVDPGAASANLRKSHFSISGDHTSNLGLSEHQAEFIERPFDVQESAVSLHHKPDNINLTQGGHVPEGESVYTHDYKPYPVGSGAVLPAASMALQRSHFEVAPGSSGVPLGQSIQQTDFVRHSIDPNRQLLDTATLQRSHFPTANEGFKGSSLKRKMSIDRILLAQTMTSLRLSR